MVHRDRKAQSSKVPEAQKASYLVMGLCPFTLGRRLCLQERDYKGGTQSVQPGVTG